MDGGHSKAFLVDRAVQGLPSKLVGVVYSRRLHWKVSRVATGRLLGRTIVQRVLLDAIRFSSVVPLVPHPLAIPSHGVASTSLS